MSVLHSILSQNTLIGIIVGNVLAFIVGIPQRIKRHFALRRWRKEMRAKREAESAERRKRLYHPPADYIDSDRRRVMESEAVRALEREAAKALQR